MTTERGFEDLLDLAMKGLPLISGPATVYFRTDKDPESGHPDMSGHIWP